MANTESPITKKQRLSFTQLNRLVDDLGAIYERLNAETNDLLRAAQRDVWRARCNLSSQQLLAEIEESNDAGEQIKRLRELAAIAGERVLPELAAISVSERYVDKVKVAAKRTYDEVSQQVMKNELTILADKLRGGLVEEIDERLDNRFRRFVNGSVSENYAGFICSVVRDERGRDVPLIRRRGAALAAVTAGDIYRVAVWFEPKRPRACWSDEVLVNDGEDMPEVHFEVEVDSSAVRFRSIRRSVQFVPAFRSPAVEFQFTAPREAGLHEIWAQVFQNHQLVQGLLIAIAVAVGGSRGAKQSPPCKPARRSASK